MSKNWCWCKFSGACLQYLSTEDIMSRRFMWVDFWEELFNILLCEINCGGLRYVGVDGNAFVLAIRRVKPSIKLESLFRKGRSIFVSTCFLGSLPIILLSPAHVCLGLLVQNCSSTLFLKSFLHLRLKLFPLISDHLSVTPYESPIFLIKACFLGLIIGKY